MNPIKMNAQQAVSMIMDRYSEFSGYKENISDFTEKQIIDFTS